MTSRLSRLCRCIILVAATNPCSITVPINIRDLLLWLTSRPTPFCPWTGMISIL